MATIGATYLSLADKFKRENPDGTTADIIELLTQTNPILLDAIAVECNDGSRHLTTVRTGLPSVTWAKLYTGVTPGKSTTAQVSDTTGMLEAWSEVDARLVNKSKNPGAFRLSEAMAFMDAMNNEVASTIFYGDEGSTPSKFTGLAPRFNLTTAANGTQIITGGGSGSDNTSIWFVVWGENACNLLYPEGSMAGLKREDKGLERTKDANGGLYEVYREKFSWDIGLSVRDWRYIVRICNIDVSDLSATAGTGANLIDKMIDAYYRLYSRKSGIGNPVIYCNRTIKQFLHKQAINVTANPAVRLMKDQVTGTEVLSFMEMPIRETDAILNTEATVS